MNLKVVLRINSGMILALGASLLVPVILSLLYQDGSRPSFLPPAAMMAARGLELAHLPVLQRSSHVSV